MKTVFPLFGEIEIDVALFAALGVTVVGVVPLATVPPATVTAKPAGIDVTAYVLVFAAPAALAPTGELHACW